MPADPLRGLAGEGRLSLLPTAGQIMFSLHSTMHRSFKTLPSLTLEASVLSATGPVDLGLSAARLFAACVTSVVAGPAKSMMEQIRASARLEVQSSRNTVLPTVAGCSLQACNAAGCSELFRAVFLK